jgi:hypothetical protein
MDDRRQEEQPNRAHAAGNSGEDGAAPTNSGSARAGAGVAGRDASTADSELLARLAEVEARVQALENARRPLISVGPVDAEDSERIDKLLGSQQQSLRDVADDLRDMREQLFLLVGAVEDQVRESEAGTCAVSGIAPAAGRDDRLALRLLALEARLRDLESLPWIALLFLRRMIALPWRIVRRIVRWVRHSGERSPRESAVLDNHTRDHPHTPRPAGVAVQPALPEGEVPDPRRTVLVVLCGGDEAGVQTLLPALSRLQESFRSVVVDLTGDRARTPEALADWRRLTPHVYQVEEHRGTGDVHATLAMLMARFAVGAVLAVGRGRPLDEVLARLRGRFPALRLVAVPERVVAAPAQARPFAALSAADLIVVGSEEAAQAIIAADRALARRVRLIRPNLHLESPPAGSGEAGSEAGSRRPVGVGDDATLAALAEVLGGAAEPR